MRIESIVENIDSIQKECQSLMEKANAFTESNDAKLRALGYEISIGVSKITAEQQGILKTLIELTDK